MLKMSVLALVASSLNTASEVGLPQARPLTTVGNVLDTLLIASLYTVAVFPPRHGRVQERPFLQRREWSIPVYGCSIS